MFERISAWFWHILQLIGPQASESTDTSFIPGSPEYVNPADNPWGNEDEGRDEDGSKPARKGNR